MCWKIYSPNLLYTLRPSDVSCALPSLFILKESPLRFCFCSLCILNHVSVNAKYFPIIFFSLFYTFRFLNCSILSIYQPEKIF